MLEEPLRLGTLYKHEGRKVIEVPGTRRCIRARTAHDPETWRGDYGDVLIFDEWQNQKFAAWNEVGAPMLLDNNGDAVFMYTARRGEDGSHARELFRKAEGDTTGRWEAFRWSSHDNPYISATAIEELAEDMTEISYRMEINAEDLEDDPSALWKRADIQRTRWTSAPAMDRIAVGVDPPGSSAECGIVVAGSARVHGQLHAFVLDDASISGSPGEWGDQVAAAYHKWGAAHVIAEVNHGGDMVEHTIHTSDPTVIVRKVHATRGKATRAEPIAARYEKDIIHHVGTFRQLEDQMCYWVPGSTSPDRLDAAVWVLAFLLLGPRGRAFGANTGEKRKVVHGRRE